MHATPTGKVRPRSTVTQLTRERVVRWLASRQKQELRSLDNAMAGFQQRVDTAREGHHAKKERPEHGGAPTASSRPDAPQDSAKELVASIVPAAQKAIDASRIAARNALARGDFEALKLIRLQITEVATVLQVLKPANVQAARLYGDALYALRESAPASGADLHLAGRTTANARQHSAPGAGIG